MQGKIHLEANSSCEPVKPNKLCASKTQWWDRHRVGIPTPKERNKKEVRGTGAK